MLEELVFRALLVLNEERCSSTGAPENEANIETRNTYTKFRSNEKANITSSRKFRWKSLGQNLHYCPPQCVHS